MSENIQVEVPAVGESITEVQISQWLKSEGEWVDSGEDLVDIETEKASVQIPSPAAGFLEGISKQVDEFAEVGDVIAMIRVAEKPAGENAAPPPSPIAASTPAAETSSPPPAASSDGSSDGARTGGAKPPMGDGFVMPAAQRLLDEHSLSADQIPATGPGGRLLKEDVLAFIRRGPTPTPPPPTPPPTPSPAPAPAAIPAAPPTPSRAITAPSPSEAASLVPQNTPGRMEEVKPLSMLRRTIAARLVEAQQTAALLTTFNEIDMRPTMEIRKKYKDAFEQRYGVKLGFMSFFAKAAVEALRRYPAINAEIRDNQVVYRHYQDIGIAIGGGKGLVVPILRNVERMSFADVEQSIADFAKLAGENKLQPEDLIGGTFTISNGGIYGSLLSTPIVNPPQSGILGLHSIQQRPVAIDGQVVIRPMMYVALTYDHRIVDGREAVQFLKAIKDVIEDPARLFLEL